MPRASILLPLAALLLAGCAIIGPTSISNGRLAYNEVINYTGDQEILNMIVRERYGQTFGMLRVASVTANVKFRASAGGEFQAWERSSNVDDLVPLSLGLGYEENPTISYVPRQGVTTLRNLIMPITVEEAFLLVEASAEPDIASREIYASVNRLRNPLGHPLAPELRRLMEVSTRLRDANVLHFGRVEEEDARSEYYLSLSSYAEAHADDVREYLEILGIEGQDLGGDDIILPFYLSSIQPGPDAVFVQTRSVLDWVRHAGSLIEVPAPHLEAGIVEPNAWADTPIDDRFIMIHSSQKRPSNAVVAVPFRGWWYYIDATDSRSKNSFRLIKLLVQLRLDQDISDVQELPVLTVPVG